MNAPLPSNEETRLAHLYQYDILDTPPEEAFDALTRLAAQICETPIALVSLLDSKRQWFKSKVGIEVSETPRSLAFCAHAILQTEPLVIPDTQKDERFATNLLAIDDPRIRFYAGVPLVTPSGFPMGTLCVIDRVARSLKAEQLSALKALAQQAVSQLELRRRIVELAQTTQQHEQTKEELESFFNLSLDMLGVATMDGYFKRVNPAFSKILGYERDELRTHSILELIHPEDRETTRQELQKLSQGLSTIDFKNRYRTKEGGYKWLAWNACPVAEKNLIYAIARDITEHNQIENQRLELLAEAQAAKTQVINILESITDAFFTLDRQWCFTYVNHQAELLLQRTREELLGKSIWNEFPAAINIGFYKEYHRAFTEQISVTFTEFYPPLNCWFLVHAYPSPEGLSIYFQDITASKQDEEKIREQAALLDIATDAIFVQSLDNKILYWNKAAERLYGYPASAVLGQESEFIYKKSSGQLAEARQIVLEKGEWYGEFEQLTQSSKEIIVESRWTLVRDSEKKPKSILVVNTDITEKKLLAAQFFRIQRLESIGTLAGGIAHDLNNLLTPMLAVSQLLPFKFPELDDRTQQLLKIIEINTKRGADLVKQVLSFSKGLEGKRTILQIEHLAWEISQVASETFPKSIEIQTDLALDLFPVVGDATQLHQVLINLCLNARDAMLEGGTLTLSAKTVVIDENYVHMNLDAKVGTYIAVTVADTGTGISPEILERIFEPFFTTKEVGKGTGLGLSTVMGIVKNHGGFINVYSEVDQGTQFKIYLPALQGEKSLQIESHSIPKGNGAIILIADDEAAIREVVKASLETYEYQVMTANDGIEALALYAQYKDKISAVLMDMMMPSMEGPVAIRTLQKINPQVKVVAMSGLSSSDLLNSAKTVGVREFLAKPFTSEELLLALHRLLKV